MTSFEIDDLDLCEPSLNLETNLKYVKCINLDSQASNLHQWAHSFYSWLTYIGQTWLIMPSSSEIVSFEEGYSQYFHNTIPDSVKAKFQQKAEISAWMEISETANTTRKNDLTSANSLMKSPDRKPDRLTKARSTYVDTGDMDDNTLVLFHKMVHKHVHTSITAYMSANGDDISILRSILGKHLMFRDPTTRTAESTDKASARQLVWCELMKSLSQIDVKTICAGVPLGDVYTAFMRVMRAESVQCIDVLHTNLYDKLCLLKFREGEDFPKFRSRAYKLSADWSDAGLVLPERVFKVKIRLAIENSGNNLLSTALEAYMRTHVFQTGKEILEKMMRWWHDHKDVATMHHITTTTTTHNADTQQIRALDAATRSPGEDEGKSHLFCRLHHIHNNCTWGGRCRFRHDGSPPDSWPRNAGEVCPKHPKGVHKWAACRFNTTSTSASTMAVPSDGAAPMAAPMASVNVDEFSIPESKDDVQACIAMTQAYILQLQKKEQEFEADEHLPATIVGSGAALFRPIPSSDERDEYDNVFGSTQGFVATIDGGHEENYDDGGHISAYCFSAFSRYDNFEDGQSEPEQPGSEPVSCVPALSASIRPTSIRTHAHYF
jgi:hypothetical protein